MSINEKDVEHVAKLARLELSAKEKTKFTKQLGNILDYAEQLKELNTDKIEPTAHAVPMSNVFREDIVVKNDGKKSFLAQAPDKNEDFYIVPKILD
ncbi:MAG: Asp-tRNA(Asn)/Glu-tRNA(Gln) amidotransferase subunit GatC [Candidatus Margulisbacteria bacterium]|nr:Asp-tRNA(Asn)/Glu-tRNA(Gln) amidotransferase subunit GatC [Candidatus Margulisiibacteriota bacterium]